MSNFMNKMLNFVGCDTDEAYDEEYYNEEQEQPGLQEILQDTWQCIIIRHVLQICHQPVLSG